MKNFLQKKKKNNKNLSEEESIKITTIRFI